MKESAATEDPVDPAIQKTSVPNGDGTNTIGLSITADTSPLEVEKLADVIVIFDTSSSMTRSMGNSNRLAVAKDAVNNLAESLIGNDTQFKDSAGNKLIRMSLISFNRDAELKIAGEGFTDSIQTYRTAVNDLTTNNGTNWEAALETANHLSIDQERTTFVIFVTDGNPSYRTSRGNTLDLEGYPETVDDAHLDVNTANNYYFYRTLDYFGELDENDPRNYNTGVVEAQSIVNQKKNLYFLGILLTDLQVQGLSCGGERKQRRRRK